jgi:hypothetical protein
MTITLATLLKDSAYKLGQFKPAQIAALEAAITLKESGKKSAPYVTCLVRGKPIKLTPEEAVRQLYVMVLRDDLGYPVSRMEVEHEVTFGREKKRADICIFDKDKTTSPYLLVELKKPKLKDGKEQLKSYCNATGAPMGVWTNGEQISYYHRKLRSQKPLPQHWTNFALGRSHFHLAAVQNTREKRVGVFLMLTGPDAKAHFKMLEAEKTAIEKAAHAAFVWRALPDKKESRIELVLEAADPTNRADWPRQHEWLKQSLDLFQRVFASRVKSLDADAYSSGPDMPQGG